MEQLAHDPRTKQQVKDALYAYIYDPVKKQFKQRIDTLILRNSLLGRYSHNHFVYKGELYNAESTHPPLRKNRLIVQLKPAMDEYLKDLGELNNTELPYVLGFINQVLNSSCDMQDYLKVLPPAIHTPLNKFIASCPCKSSRLASSKVDEMVDMNSESIKLIQRRLVLNLIT